MGLKQQIDVARADVNDEYGVTLAVREVEPGGAEVQLNLSTSEALELAQELGERAAEAAAMFAEFTAGEERRKAQRAGLIGADDLVDTGPGRPVNWRASE